MVLKLECDLESSGRYAKAQMLGLTPGVSGSLTLDGEYIFESLTSSQGVVLARETTLKRTLNAEVEQVEP